MKKVLWLGIILSFLFASHSFAAVTLSATATGQAVQVTLQNVNLSSITSVQIIVEPSPNSGTRAETTTLPFTGDTSKTTYSFTVSQFLNTSPIYVKAKINYTTGIGKNAVFNTISTNEVSITPETTEIINLSPLSTTLSNGNITVSGKLDLASNTWFTGSNATPILLYSRSSITDPSTGLLSTPLTGPIGTSIKSDGSYSWTISGSNLSPSTVYYIQQAIRTTLGTKKVDIVDSVNSSNGVVIIPGTASETADLNQRSYTFLSDTTKQTILPDPDLCAQEQAAATAAGKTPPKCSINDYLNLAMDFLIGLCGVMLVLRLMFEGYRYMTTDVPFISASAKSGFMTALLGLLLALSAYIILNTINPKLVNETINVQQLAIGIDGDTNTPTVFVSSGQMPKGVYCPGTGRSTAIAQIAQSYKGKVTYSQTNKSAAAGPDGNAVLDCSSFVNTVLKCAGYAPGTDFINEGTASIFAKAERVNMSTGFVVSSDGKTVTINNKPLKPGDVVGWPPTSSGGAGHAIIYIGNGTFYDSHGGSGRQPGNAIGVYTANQIQQLYGGSSPSKTITSVERMP